MALKIVDNLLNDLNSNGINYCHWKSNEHLDAAVNGNTDLDILFDKTQMKLIIEILESNKFHLFEAVWYRKYKGIVDYIGFDKTEGRIVHLHTHFDLDIGEVGIKSYRLPWEKIILDNKEFDHNFNIYKSSAEIEYLLLVVRTAFKYNAVRHKSNKMIAQHFDVEASWLYNQINLSKLLTISSELLDDRMTELIEKVRKKETYDEKTISSLKKLLKHHFAQQRILTSQRVTYLNFVIFLKRVQYKLGEIMGVTIRASKRSLPHSGVVLSFMGSDGAGKSTQTKELTKELLKKVDVLFMYMGSGNGPMSIHRKAISSFLRVGSRVKTSKSTKNEMKSSFIKTKEPIFKKSFLKQCILSFYSASLALEKKQRLKRIKSARNRGEIVICDRYPQTMTLGYNDGPKLYENINSPNRLLRSLARYEYYCYKLSKDIYPNIAIKLVGSLDVLHARRPEMTIEEINKKQNGILNLKFGDKTKVISMDIDKPIQQIKGEILELLSEEIHILNLPIEKEIYEDNK